MNKMTRRGLVAALGVTGAGVCMCGANEGCATFTKKGKTPAMDAAAYVIEGNTVKVALDQVPSLAAVGGSAKIIDSRLPIPIIVARTGECDYAAVSLLCPHRGVEVEYQPDQRRFRCVSLGHSKFGEDGALRSGFARTGLTRFATLTDPSDKNVLTVSF